MRLDNEFHIDLQSVFGLMNETMLRSILFQNEVLAHHADLRDCSALEV